MLRELGTCGEGTVLGQLFHDGGEHGAELSVACDAAEALSGDEFGGEVFEWSRWAVHVGWEV